MNDDNYSTIMMMNDNNLIYMNHGNLMYTHFTKTTILPVEYHYISDCLRAWIGACLDDVKEVPRQRNASDPDGNQNNCSEEESNLLEN
jgi:hypothetical protein